MLLFFYWPQQYFNVMKATPGMNSFIDHLALSLMREDSLGGLLPGTHAVLLWLMFRWKPTALRKCYPVFVFTRSYRIFVRSCRKWTVMCVTGHSKRAINTSGLPWPTNVSQQVPLLYPPPPHLQPFPRHGRQCSQPVLIWDTLQKTNHRDGFNKAGYWSAPLENALDQSLHREKDDVANQAISVFARAR